MSGLDIERIRSLAQQEVEKRRVQAPKTKPVNFYHQVYDQAKAAAETAERRARVEAGRAFLQEHEHELRDCTFSHHEARFQPLSHITEQIASSVAKIRDTYFPGASRIFQVDVYDRAWDLSHIFWDWIFDKDKFRNWEFHRMIGFTEKPASASPRHQVAFLVNLMVGGSSLNPDQELTFKDFLFANFSSDKPSKTPQISVARFSDHEGTEKSLKDMERVNEIAGNTTKDFEDATPGSDLIALSSDPSAIYLCSRYTDQFPYTRFVLEKKPIFFKGDRKSIAMLEQRIASILPVKE